MKNLTQERINERRTTLEMTWEEFHSLIEGKVREELGLNPRDTFSMKIIVRQRAEGSPAYRIDKYDFHIDVVEKNL